MIEVICIILGFLVLYLLHQPEDCLGIVKFYREFINLPYVNRCYHNCDNSVELTKQLSEKTQSSSSNEKIALNTFVDVKEHQSANTNSSEEELNIKPNENFKSITTNSPTLRSAGRKASIVEKNNDDSSREKSVYLSTSLRKHIK